MAAHTANKDVFPVSEVIQTTTCPCRGNADLLPVTTIRVPKTISKNFVLVGESFAGFLTFLGHFPNITANRQTTMSCLEFFEKE